MIYARVADGVRVYFAAVDQGVLVSGMAPGDFTATVIAPDTTTSTTMPVSETSGKPGLYTLLVPSSFLDANGAGAYALVIEANGAVTDVKVDLVRVGERDVDDVFRVSQAILGSVV